MRLRQIFESHGSAVAIIFGRFNPPHKGHRAAWEVASKYPHWYVGTNQSTQGPKDPLPFDIKIEAMKTIWPKIDGHIVAEQSWLTMASMVYEKHGGDHLIVCTDEDWVIKTLVQYNGKESTHGHYNFKQITPHATPRLSSATALRDAVVKGDRQAFAHAAGVSAETPVAGHAFFDLVAHYLLPYQNKPVKKTKKTKELTSMQEANKALRDYKKLLSELSVKPSGKMHKHHVDAGQGYTLFRDVGGYDRTYHLNRIMMAAAMADGRSNKPVDMDASSWYEKYNIAFPYTDIENMMMNQARATIPTDGEELESRGKSEEPKDTNKVSPVARPKKNKYGI